MTRRTLIMVVAGAGMVLAGAGPAAAAHPHYVVTPNGGCHAVAGGQTSIADPSHGGHHRIHENVHLGAGADGTLGSSGVLVAKGVCP